MATINWKSLLPKTTFKDEQNLWDDNIVIVTELSIDPWEPEEEIIIKLGVDVTRNRIVDVVATFIIKRNGNLFFSYEAEIKLKESLRNYCDEHKIGEVI